MRRILVVIATTVALAAASGASAAVPTQATITTTVVFGQGPPHGTFSATAPLCASGTIADQLITVGGGGESFSFIVSRTFTCSDNSGTFTLLLVLHGNASTPASCQLAGQFSVVAGTRSFATLSGHGDFCLTVIVPGQLGNETLSGTFQLP